MTTTRKSKVMYLRGLHPEVKRMFKATATRRELTLAVAVEALMRYFIVSPGTFDKCVEQVRNAKKRRKLT